VSGPPLAGVIAHFGARELLRKLLGQPAAYCLLRARVCICVRMGSVYPIHLAVSSASRRALRLGQTTSSPSRLLDSPEKPPRDCPFQSVRLLGSCLSTRLYHWTASLTFHTHSPSPRPLLIAPPEVPSFIALHSRQSMSRSGKNIAPEVNRYVRASALRALAARLSAANTRPTLTFLVHAELSSSRT
jgi:hypothetical protein